MNDQVPSKCFPVISNGYADWLASHVSRPVHITHNTSSWCPGISVPVAAPCQCPLQLSPRWRTFNIFCGQRHKPEFSDSIHILLTPALSSSSPSIQYKVTRIRMHLIVHCRLLFVWGVLMFYWQWLRCILVIRKQFVKKFAAFCWQLLSLVPPSKLTLIFHDQVGEKLIFSP